MKFFRYFLPAIAIVMFLAASLQHDKPKDSPFSGKVMALEFARTQKSVDDLWEKDPNELKKLKNQLNGDTRFFIPLYWLYFVSLSSFMFGNRSVSDRHGLLRGFMVVLVPLAISIAAVADLHENAFAMRALDRADEAVRIYVAANIKWAAIAVACIGTGLGFLDFRRKAWSLAAAAGYTATGVLMAVALLHCPHWIENISALVFASIAWTGPAIYDERVQDSPISM
jgi:hypothetical protein